MWGVPPAAAPLSSTALRGHWDAVYRTKGPHAVSWFQAEPVMSLELIGDLRLARDAAIVDVGGGASSLAARLLERGFTDITVLDVSAQALAQARAALGAEAQRICWLERDLLSWVPDRPYDLWHDRAVLHFLTEPQRRERYAEVLRSALRPGGHAVVATFAADGPTTCSGLPVARYDAEGLAAVFGDEFATIATTREEHRTPAGSAQPFTWVVLGRRA
jgi:trans-aconitate methyltransferase